MLFIRSNGVVLSIALVVGHCLALAGCSVGSDGTAVNGPSHSFGGNDMSDYYYKKPAGWTYVFSNVENIYDTTGTIARTLVGAPDTVRTLGYYCVAPNGDSIYRYAITYRVEASYAGRGAIDIAYVGRTSTSPGAFVENGAQVAGMLSLYNRPRATSTDSILFGVAGLVRTICNDLSNAGTYVWQTDTIWASAHGDSVLVWERFPGSTTLSASRCLFSKHLTDYTPWNSDLIWGSTSIGVVNANTSVTVPCGTFASTVELNVSNSASDLKVSNLISLPITENQYFSLGVGLTNEYDRWYATTDGIHFFKRDFTRSLISLSHN